MTGRRCVDALLVVVAILLGSSGIAYAHVTVQPATATAGSETILTFRVPTERDDADTVKVVLALPTDPPIPSVSLQPVPDWHADVTSKRLDRRVQGVDGPVPTAVERITWTVAQRADAIGPGEFQVFTVSAGPLPDVPQLVFKVLQYYSDGSVVRWIDPPSKSADPPHPAPVVRVVAGTTPPSAGDGNGDSWIAAAAFVAGLLGLGAGSAALAVARRSAARSRS